MTDERPLAEPVTGPSGAGHDRRRAGIGRTLRRRFDRGVDACGGNSGASSRTPPWSPHTECSCRSEPPLLQQGLRAHVNAGLITGRTIIRNATNNRRLSRQRVLYREHFDKLDRGRAALPEQSSVRPSTRKPRMSQTPTSRRLRSGVLRIRWRRRPPMSLTAATDPEACQPHIALGQALWSCAQTPRVGREVSRDHAVNEGGLLGTGQLFVKECQRLAQASGAVAITPCKPAGGPPGRSVDRGHTHQRQTGQTARRDPPGVARERSASPGRG
jgi:hypothetical protein